jgi:hypothetical protein
MFKAFEDQLLTEDEMIQMYKDLTSGAWGYVDVLQKIKEAQDRIPANVTKVITYIERHIADYGTEEFRTPDTPNEIPYVEPGQKGVPQARGGDWMVTRPTLFMAGESGPERATFQPVTNNNRTYNINANYPYQSHTSLMADLDRRQQLERLMS